MPPPDLPHAAAEPGAHNEEDAAALVRAVAITQRKERGGAEKKENRERRRKHQAKTPPRRGGGRVTTASRAERARTPPLYLAPHEEEDAMPVPHLDNACTSTPSLPCVLHGNNSPRSHLAAALSPSSLSP